MSGEFDEQALIQAARQGDIQAFNLLVERYQDFLFRIAVRMLGDEDSAADACQLAWISAFRNINGFRGDRLQTWLARVLVNICYDEIRRRHRRHEVPLLPVNTDDEEIEAASWLADPAPSVEQRVEMDEFEIVMQKCLQSLTPVYRTMLVLVDIEGLSYEEAAIAAAVPPGTVRSRLARARMALRQSLQQSAGSIPAHYSLQLLPLKQTRLRVP